MKKPCRHNWLPLTAPHYVCVKCHRLGASFKTIGGYYKIHINTSAPRLDREIGYLWEGIAEEARQALKGQETAS